MSDAWMPSLRLKLTRQEFDQLPRHPAYQYEYLDHSARLSPWPRYYHALLDVTRLPTTENSRVSLGLVAETDLAALVPVFLSGFARLQPFGSLEETHRRLAVEQSLQQTFAGGDGPWAADASYLAREGGRIVGAILITLLPGGNPLEPECYLWQERPPPDLWTRGEGQPHLTWIFVDRPVQGSGVGTRLLQEAACALHGRGYRTLWSTFMLGNDSSLLWHWRNGFELLPHA